MRAEIFGFYLIFVVSKEGSGRRGWEGVIQLLASSYVTCKDCMEGTLCANFFFISFEYNQCFTFLFILVLSMCVSFMNLRVYVCWSGLMEGT